MTMPEAMNAPVRRYRCCSALREAVEQRIAQGRLIIWPARAASARKINTNTVEGYYSIFKRRVKGVY
jgi:hypothetical protein